MMSIEYNALNIKDKISKAIEFYNNSFHSVIKEKPINVEIGQCDKIKIHNSILVLKRGYIEKRNRRRENYTERRKEGFIKNYKSLRHKQEPKYKFCNLENIHPSNIKRKLKFEGILDTKEIED